jgi:flavin-binding protein dodecin
MTNHVYKISELYGSSPKGLEAAIENAVAQAARTVRNMRWLQVTEIRAHLENGKVDHWQVGVKIGFTVESGP